MPLPDDVPSSCESFIDMINRGGLIKPSTIINDACVAAWVAYLRIMDNIESRKLFLASKMHRSVFIQFLLIHMKSADKYENMFTFKCVAEHPFQSILEKVGEKFFNVMAKNFVSETNSTTHRLKKRKPASKEPTSNDTKRRKLQSDT